MGRGMIHGARILTFLLLAYFLELFTIFLSTPPFPRFDIKEYIVNPPPSVILSTGSWHRRERSRRIRKWEERLKNDEKKKEKKFPYPFSSQLTQLRFFFSSRQLQLLDELDLQSKCGRIYSKCSSFFSLSLFLFFKYEKVSRESN